MEVLTSLMVTANIAVLHCVLLPEIDNNHDDAVLNDIPNCETALLMKRAITFSGKLIVLPVTFTIINVISLFIRS